MCWASSSSWPRGISLHWKTLLYWKNLSIHLTLLCVTFSFPQAQGDHQGDLFWRCGDHQEVCIEGTQEDPRTIFLAMHRSMAEKDRNYSRGITLKEKPCSLLFGIERNCLWHQSGHFSDTSCVYNMHTSCIEKNTQIYSNSKEYTHIFQWTSSI